MAITVASIAFKDIVDYMREQNIKIQDEHRDVWVVSATRLFCREQ
jgi:hypothetical protein